MRGGGGGDYGDGAEYKIPCVLQFSKYLQSHDDEGDLEQITRVVLQNCVITRAKRSVIL